MDVTMRTLLLVTGACGSGEAMHINSWSRESTIHRRQKSVPIWSYYSCQHEMKNACKNARHTCWKSHRNMSLNVARVGIRPNEKLASLSTF